MLKNILLSLRIAGLSIFFLFIGSSIILANTGPSDENSQLKDFYKYVFGEENINFDASPKIQFNILQDGEEAAIRSEQIKDGEVKTEDLANKSVTFNKLHGGDFCKGDKVLVFDNDGDAVCTPKSTLGKNLIFDETTISGTGTDADKLTVNFESVQEKVEGECTGENEFVAGFQDKEGGGVEFKCVTVVADNDGDSSNEIQNVTQNGGLERDDDLNFKVISCDSANQILKWNGSREDGQWVCADDAVGSQISETDVVTIITNAGFLKSFTETDPTVKSFAKTDLPNCGEGEVLKSSGGVLSCVADQNTQIENTDNQALTFLENSNTLSLENGGTVNLSKYLDNTDTQLTDTEISGFGYIKASEISGSETDPIWNTEKGNYFNKTDLPNCGEGEVLKSSGGVLSCVADQNTQTENTDNQALTLLENSNTLSLENGGTVNLSKYLDNTDTQLTDAEISEFGYIKASEISGSETDPIFVNSNLNTKIYVSDWGVLSTQNAIVVIGSGSFYNPNSNNRLTINTENKDIMQIYNFEQGTDPENFGNVFIGRLGKGGLFAEGNTGNVGIGTTNPTEKLHVSGNIAFSGTLKKTGAEMRCGDGEVLVGFGNDGPICETAKSVSGGVAVWQ